MTDNPFWSRAAGPTRFGRLDDVDRDVLAELLRKAARGGSGS
jgi:hypothetical protein